MRIPVIDGHNDLPWKLRELGDPAPDLVAGDPRTHTDLPRMAAGGLAGQFWSVYVPCSMEGAAAVTGVLEQIDRVHRLVADHPDRLLLVQDADELEAAITAADGRTAGLLGAEGGHCLDGSLGVLRMLRRLGVRYLTLTHNQNTAWADAATDEPEHGGLTDLGRAIVAEMNRIGMLVDLSHVAPSTMHDALDVTAAPVIFSHSSARAVHDHPRNVPDDVLTRLAANGGTCMVTFVPFFITDRPTATIDDVVAHVEHVREVAGIDHIGLGGDYDGVGTLPSGLEDVSGYPRLLDRLADRGWSTEELEQLAWRNTVRVLREAEAVVGENPPRRRVP